MARAPDSIAKILCIGLGNAGSNVVSNIYDDDQGFVDYLVIDSDKQKLDSVSNDVQTHLLAADRAHAEGAGGDPRIGQEFAKADREFFVETLRSYRILILITGLSGGVGIGTAGVITEICQKETPMPVLVFAFHPWEYEPEKWHVIARHQVGVLAEHGAVVINLYNTNAGRLYREEKAYRGLSWQAAYRHFDSYIADSIRMLVDMLERPGLINIDFADARAVLGYGKLGAINVVSHAEFENLDTILDELQNLPIPSASSSMDAKAVLVYVILRPNFPSQHWSTIQNAVRARIESAEHHKIGFRVNPDATSDLQMLVIATGISLPPDMRLERRKQPESEQKESETPPPKP